MRCERCDCEIFGRITPDMEPICIPCQDNKNNKDLLKLLIMLALFMLAVLLVDTYNGRKVSESINQVQGTPSSSKAVLRVHPDY